MTDCAWECDRVLKIVLCVNCWKGVFKLPPSGEICILGDFKYCQKIRKDRSDGENTPEIRGEKLEIRIKDEFIKLGQALKLAGVVEDGVEAKYAINDGLVLVNGEVENRRGRKIHPGDTISYDGKDIYVIG